MIAGWFLDDLLWARPQETERLAGRFEICRSEARDAGMRAAQLDR